MFSSELNPSDGLSPLMEMAQRTDTPQVLINLKRNNIHIVVSSEPGRQLYKLTSGLAGFNGGQKTSQKAALAMLDTLQRRMKELGFSRVRINFRGMNSARGMIVSQLRRLGLQITEIADSTRIPFGGCRPRKARRL